MCLRRQFVCAGALEPYWSAWDLLTTVVSSLIYRGEKMRMRASLGDSGGLGLSVSA